MTAVNVRSKENLREVLLREVWQQKSVNIRGSSLRRWQWEKNGREQAWHRDVPPRSVIGLSALTAMGPGWMPAQGTKVLQAHHPHPPPTKRKKKPHWSSIKLQYDWHGSAESPDSAYWSCRLRRQQGCGRGGHRGCCALLGQRLLLRLVDWGSSRKRRLHLGRKLRWWRRRRLSWRRMENLGLWARWHGWRRRNRGWDCCCWWLLSPYARGSVVRGGGATRYGGGWVLMQSWLRERGTVNVAPLRPGRHYRRVHRTGRTGHLCLLKGKT